MLYHYLMRLFSFTVLPIILFILFGALGCSAGKSPTSPPISGQSADLASALSGVEIQNPDLKSLTLDGVNLLPWGMWDIPLGADKIYPLEIGLDNRSAKISLSVTGATLLVDGSPAPSYSGSDTARLEIKSPQNRVTIHLEIPGPRSSSRTRDILVRTVPTNLLPIPATTGIVKYTDPATGLSFDIADRELEIGVLAGTKIETVESLVGALDCELLRAIPKIDTYRVRIPLGASLEHFRSLFRESSIVRFADLNAILNFDLVPNDPYQDQEYENTLCRRYDAWDITTGSSSTIVAVIDSGIMRDHPDLAANALDGKDFIDPPGDGHGGATPGSGQDVSHGTHCAGIIGAVGNNGEGICGQSWSTKLLSLRVFPTDGSGATDSSVDEAIIYAADYGVTVISMSLGAPYCSGGQQSAVSYAYNKNDVLVAAAGNAGSSVKDYPAALPQVIAVAATDSGDHKPDWSDYGSWVACTAPGVDIISSIFYQYSGGDPYSVPEDQRYAKMSGTSMACPQVAGLVASRRAFPNLHKFSAFRSGRLHRRQHRRRESLAGRHARTGSNQRL